MDLYADIPEVCQDCAARPPTTLIITHQTVGGMFHLLTLFFCPGCTTCYQQRHEE